MGGPPARSPAPPPRTDSMLQPAALQLITDGHRGRPFVLTAAWHGPGLAELRAAYIPGTTSSSLRPPRRPPPSPAEFRAPPGARPGPAHKSDRPAPGPACRRGSCLGGTRNQAKGQRAGPSLDRIPGAGSAAVPVVTPALPSASRPERSLRCYPGPAKVRLRVEVVVEYVSPSPGR
jgi:hypothetical protein